MSRYKYQDTMKDGNGKVIADGIIKVYLTGTSTLASFYTLSSGGTAASEITSDDNGGYYFYVDEADYPSTQHFDLVLSKTGFTPKSYTDITIFPIINPDWIDSRDYATLELANTAAYTAGKLLIISQNYTLTANTTLTASIMCIPGGSFTKAAAYTLTINGSFNNLDNGQVFISFTTGVIFGSNSIKEVNPQWWGENTTPGTTDMTAAFASMFASIVAVGVANIIIPPGIYLVDKLDFSALYGMTRLFFDARQAKIIAQSNQTNFIIINPGANKQFLGNADIKFGFIDLVKASKTIDNGIYIRHFNDCYFSIHSLMNGTGTGVFFDEGGTPDYGIFNNFFEFNNIGGMDGAAIAIAGNTGVIGFQGNTVKFGQISYNLGGITTGQTKDENTMYNLFMGGPIEINTQYGIYERGGRNTFLINNTNANGTYGLGCETGLTYKSTFIGSFPDGYDSAILEHFLLDSGVIVPQLIVKSGIETGGGGGAGTAAHITFTTAFPNACESVVASHFGTGETVNVVVNTISASGFNCESSNVTPVDITWIAIGN